MDNGLPTPENSATEASETEEGSQKKRKRLRRRWKTIMGESYSDCDSDDDDLEELIQTGDDDVEHKEEDQERIFFKRYHKPQHTFENWQTDASKRAPIRRNKISFSKLNRIQKRSKNNMEKSFAFASHKNKVFFNSISQGLEYIDPELGDTETFNIKHIRLLTNLLQLHVSRHNWTLAYKCFALLIRIPKVDIRNLWGIGDRILAEREPVKSLEFLEWMNSVYSSRMKFSEDINYQRPPVFTKGSRDHVPKYTVTFLWISLISCTREMEESGGNDNLNEGDALLDLIERISELILSPPFMEDSEIWFIYALCHMIKADKLSSQFNQNLVGSARDIASNQVFQHIQNSKTFLQTCASKGDFHFPKRYIERQLESFEKRIQQLDIIQSNTDQDDIYHSEDFDYHISHYEDSSSDGLESSS